MNGLRSKLLGPTMALGRNGWIWLIVITAVAGLLRFWNLGHPHQLIFDETYYVKDGWSLWNFGYEVSWPDEADEAFVAGNPAPESDSAAYVVHPPLGKWLIGAGVMLFGPGDGAGWRFSSAVVGTLMVALLIIVVTKMFASRFFGVIAGILLAVEGHHIVMSRAGLLDIFLAFFVLAAFTALVFDRFWHRNALLQELEHGSERTWWQRIWRPWWLLAALLIGAATAVKLSGLAFVVAFAVLTLVWDWNARRILYLAAESNEPVWRQVLLKDWVPSVITGGLVFLVTYVASWGGWILSSGGWGRDWATENPATGLGQLLPDWLRALLNYHLQSTQFHAGLDGEHNYAASPWTWWFMGRPTSFYYKSLEAGEDGCLSEKCSEAILDLANPVLWWAGAAAFVVVMFLAIAKLDWRAWSVLTAYGAGFFVWLLFPERTMFFFYTITYVAFLIIGVLLAFRVWMNYLSPADSPTYSKTAAATLMGFVVIVILVSAFFWPVWTGEQISYEQWRSRMWLSSWI